MNRLRSSKTWIAALAGLAFAVHLVVMALGVGSPKPAGQPAGGAEVYVDAVLGPMQICASPDHQREPGNGSSDGDGHCLFCQRFVNAGPDAPVVASWFALIAPADQFTPAPTGVSSLADHLRLGGIRGRAPPSTA